MTWRGGFLVGSLSLAACGGASSSSGAGLPLLGDGGHTLDDVTFTVVASGADGLSSPTDAAFRPDGDDELWVTLQGSNGMAIISGASTARPSVEIHAGTVGSSHFLAKPASLAFGKPGFLATAQQEDEVTQPTTPADFMGPTLWTSDPAEFEGGHASHYDMLHNSPNGSGIAWERGNAYWIYDGYHGSLTRYDFGADHGPGGSDHSDGVVARYLDDELGYRRGVVAHVAFDPDTDILYAADPKNQRIVALDTTSGTEGGFISPNYDGTLQYFQDDADSWVVADAASVELDRPTGLELHDGLLWVTDWAAGRVLALTPEGELVDWIDLERTRTLAGLTVTPDGVFVVDQKADELLRLTVE